MHFYTSISKNYLPKARVLAKSVKKYCRDSYFSLVVSDRLPEDFDLSQEPFDEVVYIDELGIPVDNLSLWIYTHAVVEICTAVKGQALLNFLQRSEKVVYLDPDIAVFDDLKELENLLDQKDIVLTPHLTAPETTLAGIMDNEISTLKHGIYNLGFVAVRNSENGMKFATWWRDRLVEFCYDDIPNGIFTDQSWVDMAPAILDGVYILREPNYNVATWNLSHRQVTEKEGKYFVNGKPLQFYHFSGFDSGAQEAMLNKWGENNPALYALREWYIAQQAENGQEALGKSPSIYATYSNGEKIETRHRVFLRSDPGTKAWFSKKDPFDAADPEGYYSWIHLPENRFVGLSAEQQEICRQKEEIERLQEAVARYRRYLAPAIKLKNLFRRRG